jgi:hypothetical protein
LAFFGVLDFFTGFITLIFYDHLPFLPEMALSIIVYEVGFSKMTPGSYTKLTLL